SSGSTSPYRGWMKWHHIAGLVGGLFVITWVFSGWLSMSPFGGIPGGDSRAVADRYTGEQTAGFVRTQTAALSSFAPDARELRFIHIGGNPVVLAVDGEGRKRALDGIAAAPAQPAVGEIEALARSSVPEGRLVRTELLTEHDAYWYATGDPRRDGRPLPLLRLTSDDPHGPWPHLEPPTGEFLGASGNGRRGSRRLCSALPSLDLPRVVRPRWL